MGNGFHVVAAGSQLADVAQQHSDLQRAVAAGELWLEADVAERAAQRCDRAVREIDALVADAEPLTRRRKFGDNADGRAAAERFARAGQDYVDTMKNAQRVFVTMAATYRAAGRPVAEPELAGQQLFRDQAE